MLLPRYSLRFLLGLLTAASLVFLVLSRGLRGNPLAGAVGVALVTLAALLATHVVAFAVLASLSRVTRSWRRRRADIGSRPTLLLALVASLGICSGPARGQTAFTLSGGMQRPVASVTAHGLTVSVETTWPAGHYQPLLIRAAAVPPAAATDRRLSLVAQAHTYLQEPKQLHVQQWITVPGNGATVQTWLALPSVPEAGQLQVRVYENGRDLKGLAQYVGINQVNNGWYGAVGAPLILAIDDAAPDSTQLRLALPHDYMQGWDWRTGQQLAYSDAPQPLETLVHCPPALALPTRWIDYTALDVVALPVEKAQQLSREQPAVWQAIRRWCAAGGNLWLYMCGGDQFERLPEVEELVGHMPAAAPAGEANLPAERPGWYKPQPKHYVPRVLDASFDSAYASIEQQVQQRKQQAAAQAAKQAAGITIGGVTIGDAPPATGTAGQQAGKDDEEDFERAPAPTPPERAHFVWRPYGLGTVCAMRTGSAFAGTPTEWGAVLNTLGPQRWNWERRYGLQAGMENVDFWRMLIPEVGFASVWTFQALITGFVLVVGPLNYWWFRRRKTLHALLVTVPLAALLATGGLVAYALAADGLQTRFRARSVTLLDQSSQDAVCWSWQSYYAGLTPSDGLVFDEQTYVTPIGPVTGATLGGGDRDRYLVWDGQQRMRRGWLSARTPTQLLALRSRTVSANLSLLPAATEGEPPSVRNDLGVDVDELYWMDSAGRCFHAAALPDGAAAAGTPMDAAETHRRLSALDASQVLQFPREMQKSGLAAPGQTWLRMFTWAQTSPLDLRSGESLGERTREQALAQQLWLAPGRYVAVTRRGVEVDAGLPRVEESGSFHVVLGQW